MARRIVTAREQHAMLSPWRTALDYHSPSFGRRPFPTAPKPTGPHQWTLRDHIPSDYADAMPITGVPSEEPQSGKWYHASPYEIPEGAKVIPGGAPSPGGDDYYDRYTQNRRNHVWISPSLEKAQHWLKNWAGGGSIYEVHPGDRPQQWNLNKDLGWVVPHATVKRKVASGFDPMAVTNRLKGEFHDWFDALPEHRLDELRNIEMHPFMDHHENNPVSHWPTVERFLKDKYPAAHRGFMTGHEDASMWLDNPNNEYEDPMLEGDDEFGSLPPPEPYSSADHQKLGYDPQEIAAGMVLLHNRAHSGRQDSYLETDKKRLVDIFNKRQQMQRNYEQRTGAVDGWDHPAENEGFDAWRNRLWDGVMGGKTFHPNAPGSHYEMLSPWRMAGRAERYKDMPAEKPDLMIPVEEMMGYAHDHTGLERHHGPLTHRGLPRPETRPEEFEDIKRSGVIKRPLLLNVYGDQAQLDDGHHRLSIADHLGMSHVPVYVWHLKGDEAPDVLNDAWRPSHAKPIGETLRNYLQSQAVPNVP